MAINSAQGPAYDGIGSARSILRYLANLGNRAASRRLAELDQMCAHLSVQTETPNQEVIRPELLMQSFSFGRTSSHGASGLDTAQVQDQDVPVYGTGVESEIQPVQDGATGGAAQLADIVLEGENNLYWMYNNPSLSLTGVDLADWERLETQLAMDMNT